MLSAAIAGIAARLLCHPLDTIKTVAFTGFAGDHIADIKTSPHPSSPSSSSSSHLLPTAQAQSKLTHGQPHSTFKQAGGAVWRREGLRGLYRGVGVACVGSAPGVALYLSTYDAAQQAWQRLGQLNASASDGEPPSWLRRVAAATPPSVRTFSSGLAAEAVSCIVWVPIDVSKERLQSQPPGLQGRYTGSLDALRTILRNEGVSGLYKGYWSTLGSFGPFSAVYFVCYEAFTRRLRQLLPTTSSASATTDTTHEGKVAAPHKEASRNAFLVALLGGAGGNVVASLVTNPLELVKTRLQVQRAILTQTPTTDRALFTYEYSGLLNGIATITRQEGPRALWKGVGCRMAYTAPNAALTMAFYETVKVRLGC